MYDTNMSDLMLPIPVCIGDRPSRASDSTEDVCSFCSDLRGPPVYA